MQNDKRELVIVGLGNPGPRYRNTLHNVGFKIVEKLAEAHGWTWKFEERFQAEVAKGELDLTTFHLLRPETFMNLSGEAVREYLRYYHLDVNVVVVVVDDADIGFGEIRIRPSGGSGGHNGLKSIEKELATSGFKRLRMGIGRPLITVGEPVMSLADYVLMGQGEQVWDRLEPSMKQAVSLLEKMGLGEINETRKEKPL